ncbi:hypothetical protein AgCh_031675 [Apium graveolens]
MGGSSLNLAYVYGEALSFKALTEGTRLLRTLNTINIPWHLLNGVYMKPLHWLLVQPTINLQRDEEEEAQFKAKIREQVNVPSDLPPQLLFVYQVGRLLYTKRLERTSLAQPGIRHDSLYCCRCMQLLRDFICELEEQDLHLNGKSSWGKMAEDVNYGDS